MRDLQVCRVVMVCTSVALGAGAGAGTASADGPIVIDANTKAQKGVYPLAVPAPTESDAELGKLVTEVQTFDFGVSSWFGVIDPRSFLADLKNEGLSIEPQRWKDVGAFGVIKARVTRQGERVKLEFRLYEVEKGAIAALSKDYEGSVGETRHLVHKWCNEVVKYFTGDSGFFGSRIAYVRDGKKGQKSIGAMDFDGNGASSVTSNGSANILPALSPSGKFIAFTSYMRQSADLYLKSLPDGRPRRIASYPGMNTGAAWSPDGSRIALTLSRDGNAEIYVIKAANGQIERRLTNNRYIDTSPTFSPDGSEIAFVSDREGSPQVYVMKADGSAERRVSPKGTYNQTPTFCPKPGKRLLAFTSRDDLSGRYDIVTLDLDNNNKMTRVTQDQGNNEEPTWAPNCHVLAFASRRKQGSGIYIGNADGTGQQWLVAKGALSSPDWGK